LLSLAESQRNISSEVTFYGARDNCPPGGDIAHPVIHKEAGGTGTWADPITFAGDSAAIPVGAKIYYPRLSKYFIFEDDCEECIDDWKNGKKYHVDLWMGPDTLSPSTLVACENALTLDKDEITLDPKDDYYVDTTPLYNGATNKCIVNAPPCTDKGNECGNDCEIPNSATCAELAKMLLLTLERFQQLNPKLDCNKTVPAGTSVCQGGT